MMNGLGKKIPATDPEPIGCFFQDHDIGLMASRNDQMIHLPSNTDLAGEYGNAKILGFSKSLKAVSGKHRLCLS